MNHEWEEVDKLANALFSWLGKGGFAPDVLYSKELGVEFNAALAHAACDFARRRSAKVFTPSDINILSASDIGFPCNYSRLIAAWRQDTPRDRRA